MANNPWFNTHINIATFLRQGGDGVTKEIIDYYNNIISCMSGNIYWMDENGF